MGHKVILGNGESCLASRKIAKRSRVDKSGNVECIGCESP